MKKKIKERISNVLWMLASVLFWTGFFMISFIR